MRKPAAEIRNAIALAEAQLSVQQRYRIEKARALRLLAKDAHSEWMDECVPKLMDMGKDQLVAVAACLNMWRDAWEETHPDGADDPGPDRPQKQLQAARKQLTAHEGRAVAKDNEPLMTGSKSENFAHLKLPVSSPGYCIL